jgi:hypothetical protein
MYVIRYEDRNAYKHNLTIHTVGKLICCGYITQVPGDVQSTAHQNIHFGLCAALISMTYR